MNSYLEVKAAGNVLHAATKRANESISTFNGWLMVATGASFSLVIGNIEQVSKSLSLRSLKCALILLLVSLIIGIITKLLIGMVSAGIGSQDDSQAITAKLLEDDKPFDVEVFITELSRGLLPPYRWIAKWSMRRAKSGDIAVGQRFTSKLSQFTGFLVFIQAIAVVAAGAVAVYGIGNLP